MPGIHALPARVNAPAANTFAQLTGIARARLRKIVTR